MTYRKLVTIAESHRYKLALLLIILVLSCGAKSIEITSTPEQISSHTMALPERAYAERQQLSPIKIDGVIQEVSCENSRCRVKILIESVKRNTSARRLFKGDVITIVDITTQNANPDSGLPIQQKNPMIGLPDNTVNIPPPFSRTEAWLRPAKLSSTNTYELMAGPFGFGPNLEE